MKIEEKQCVTLVRDEKDWYWKYLKKHFGITKESNSGDLKIVENTLKNKDFDTQNVCGEKDLFEIDAETREEIRKAIEEGYESKPLDLNKRRKNDSL